MLNNPQPQPTPEQIAQSLQAMDERLDQQFPGYLAVLERLRQPNKRGQQEREEKS